MTPGIDSGKRNPEKALDRSVTEVGRSFEQRTIDFLQRHVDRQDCERGPGVSKGQHHRESGCISR